MCVYVCVSARVRVCIKKTSSVHCKVLAEFKLFIVAKQNPWLWQVGETNVMMMMEEADILGVPLRFTSMGQPV